MFTLYDAARCPFAARVRIVLAEKAIPYEPVEIDLDNRPAWLYEKNPAGRVPVLEEDNGFILVESRVIIEYLDERFPDPPLMPADPEERALARLAIERFGALSGAYYDLRRERSDDAAEAFHSELGRLDRELAGRPYLTGAAYGLADVAYLPWILRAEAMLGVDLDRHEDVSRWHERVADRPAVAEEIELLGLVAAART